MNEEVLIGQCLNGDRAPDCDRCPAHSSRKGRCCFGVRHEYEDPDCTACVLEEECAEFTHQPVRTAAPRIIHASRPTTKVVRAVAPGSRSGQVTVVRDIGPQPGEPLLVQQPITPEPLKLDPTTSLFKRFFIVSSWGAGEGFLEMALNFFRKRRPD